jgi:hypothetical protein
MIETPKLERLAMSNWTLKSPDSFPIKYGMAVREALQSYVNRQNGESVIWDDIRTDEEWRRRAEDFRYWRWNLRKHPLHDLHKLETDFTIRLVPRRNETGGRCVSVRIYRKVDERALQKILESR